MVCHGTTVWFGPETPECFDRACAEPVFLERIEEMRRLLASRNPRLGMPDDLAPGAGRTAEPTQDLRRRVTYRNDMVLITHGTRPAHHTPWVMAMRWNDLAFLHWPVEHEVLRPLIPRQLELQTWEGTTWLGITPFEMSHVRARFAPPIPGLSFFPELNVRTYVSAGNRPGVWFFSLDAGCRPAVWAARVTFGLPYHSASMGISRENGSVRYRSVREGVPHGEACFRGSYRPTGPVRVAAPGTLEHWLTERYCLYSVRGGRLLRGEIQHSPWPLQDASADIEQNTIALPIGVRLAGPPPLVHFARCLDVRARPPLRLGR